MSSAVKVVTAIGLVAVGLLFGGLVGALAGLVAVIVGFWRGSRTVAAIAFVALVVAALLTAFEAPATGQAPDYLFDFALDRPLAAETGRIAGIFFLVAVVLAAIREREPSSRIQEGRIQEGRIQEGRIEEGPIKERGIS